METADKTEVIETRNVAFNWLAGVTIADGLMIAIGLAALVMRFVDLGKLPLSPAEAAEALAAWGFWRPDGAPLVNNPAYFSLTSLLLPLLGDRDAVMRLVPALFGLGIVLLPWLLRRQLGAVGALTAALLLAVSPLQAIVSRTAGGDAIALFALLLLVAAGLRYAETAEFRWLAALLAGLALGLTSSPLFYGGLFTLAGWARPAWRQRLGAVEPTAMRKAVTGAVILFLALGALFLWYLPGLGAAARLPVDWLGQFRFRPGDVGETFLALLRYEPFLTLALVTAVIRFFPGANGLARRLIIWTAGVLLLLLLQPGQINNAALFTLPGALLAGLLADDILQTRLSNVGRVWAGGLFLLLGLIGVNLARFSRAFTQTGDLTPVWVILMATAVILVTVYFVSAREATTVIQGAFLAILAFFILFQWGTGWWLSHDAANDPRERWVATATDDDVRLLAATLQDISHQVTRSDRELNIFSQADTPVLRWYLRDFSRLQFGASLPLAAEHDAVISPAQAEPALGSDYSGADYGLLRTGVQPGAAPSQSLVLDVLRWWLFHESTLAVAEERVILWWRTDLGLTIK